MIYAYFGPDANVMESLRRSYKISIDQEHVSLFPEVEQGTYRPVLIDQLAYINKVSGLLLRGNLLIMTCHPVFCNLLVYLITHKKLNESDLRFFYISKDGSSSLATPYQLYSFDKDIWEANLNLIFEVPDMV